MSRIKQALFATALVLGACAGDVGDIDRTQPNKVKKALLEGEWYFQPTVIDVQYNQGLLFEGLAGGLDRVRWEIRQNELIAYRSYALQEGAEQDRSPDGEGFRGTPVAAFAVQRHFDVRREYNTATGEQSNVLIENDFDRPWWEREYMRVDWSRNILGNTYELSGGVSALASAGYYVQEHEVDNPYRAEVRDDAINVVNSFVLSPDFSTCYYTFLDPYFCGSSSAKLKLSFKRVPNEQTYEPLYYPDGIDLIDDRTNRPIKTDYNGARCDVVDPNAPPLLDVCQDVVLPMFSRFGYFRTERRTFSTDRGEFTRDGRVFLANRHNLWQRAYDSQGTLIPAREREPGKIIYYTNPDFPMDDVFTASKQIEADWDRAFKETVAAVKGVGASQVPRVFEVRANACTVAGATAFADRHGFRTTLREYGINDVTSGNLMRACSVLEYASNGEFTWQKPGDIRYNFMHWVDTPQIAGPLGYGPSGADPITGEIVTAVANMYGAAVESYAAYASDVIALMNGKSEIDDITDGETIRAHLASVGGFNFGTINPGKLMQMVGAMDSHAQSLPQQGNAPRSASAKLESLRGSAFEREFLLSDDIRRAMLSPSQYQLGQAMGSSATASPLAWMEEDVLEGRHAAFRRLAGDSIMMAEWSDDGMAHLADELKDLSWEEVYAWMRREIYRGVMAHEVGHTLGLRHNFAGSYDALNYHREFWDHYDPVERAVHRRDEITNAPTSAERVMYSSIMDYDARFYADSLRGIGPYDVAAIKFGYGQIVEAFEPGVMHPSLANPRLGVRAGEGPDGIPATGDERTFRYDHAQGWMTYLINNSDYTELPVVMSRPTDVTATQPLLAIDGELGSSATGDPANLWKRRDIPFKDYYDQMVAFYNDRVPNDSDGDEVADDVFVLVPYKFCPDERMFETNIECQVYDKGANTLELVQDRIERYQKYYYFTNFKRDRFAFNDSNYVDTYLARLTDRFFFPMSAMFKSYIYTGRYRDSIFQAAGTVRDNWIAAAYEGLNFLVSVVQQPEPGHYCLESDNTYRPWLGTEAEYEASCAQKLEVPLGVGKHYFTNWTNEYNYKATVIGSFWDKYAALWAMTSNSTNFWRDNANFLDAGAFNLSYWNGGLQNAMMDVFSDAFLNIDSPYAWRVQTGSGEPSFLPVPVQDIYDTGITPTSPLPKLQSASSWTLQYYSVLLPMARFNSFYDYTDDFSWFARVCLEGYSDCTSFDEATVGATRFEDPRTHYVYVAPNNNPANPGTPASIALGARMLERVNDYVAAVYDPAQQEYDDAVTSGVAADIAQARLQLEAAEASLNEMVSFLDVVRELAYNFEFGG